MDDERYSDERDDVIEDYAAEINAHYNGFKSSSGGRPRLDSRMSLCLASKGLINAPGENNCFLNASIQLLWHVNVFRRSFRLLDGHGCLENASIFCALKKIFHQFEDSDVSVLAANGLRQAMANAFMDERRFQLGRMDDAAECLENILTRLHYHTAWREHEDSCSALHCIPHQKFALNILEQTSCNCRATSEPKSFYQFVHYVHASALVEQSCVRRKHALTFGELLRRTALQGENRLCPDEKRCLYKTGESITSVQTTLLNRPDVLMIGIIWDTDSPSAHYINDVMDCISETFYVVDLFDNVLDEEYKHLEMKLTGVVTYYGRHYTSFFYNIREQQWTYFDDAQVSKIGSSWEKVKQKCERTRFQPLLIVFTNGGGSLVTTQNAPTNIEFVSKEILLTAKPAWKQQQQSARRKPRKKRGKHRHDSTRISHKTNCGDHTSERCSSRSSNSSVSPTSPTSATNHKPSHPASYNATLPLPTTYPDEIHHNSGGGKRFRNSSEELRLSTGSYSKPPKALQQSASDGSIAEHVNGHRDFVDTAHRKRSGSMKKKAANVLKGMNPMNSRTKNSKHKNESITADSISTKNENENASDTTDYASAKAAGRFADVGYAYNYNDNKRSKTKGQNSPVMSRSQNKKASPVMHFPSQLKNLATHHEHLRTNAKHAGLRNKSQHVDVNDVRKGDATYYVRHNHDVRDVGRVEVKHHGNDLPNDHREQRENDFQYGDSVVELPRGGHELNTESLEEMLSRGDRYLTGADFYERKSDLVNALQMCTSATMVYRDASKLPGVNDDLLEYVNSKRNESFQRSQQIQQTLDDFLDDTDTIEPPHYHVRTSSTSGYSSMSEATIKSENVDSDWEYNDNVRGTKNAFMKDTNNHKQTFERVRYEQPSRGSSIDDLNRSFSKRTDAEHMRKMSLELLESSNADRRTSGTIASSSLSSIGAGRKQPPRSLNLNNNDFNRKIDTNEHASHQIPTPTQVLRQPTAPTPTYYSNDYRQTLNSSFNGRMALSVLATGFLDESPTLDQVTSSYSRDRVQRNSFPTSTVMHAPENHSDEVRANRRYAEHVHSIYDNVDDDGLNETDGKSHETTYTALRVNQQFLPVASPNMPSSISQDTHAAHLVEDQQIVNRSDSVALNEETMKVGKIEDSTTAIVRSFVKKLKNQNTPTNQIETIYDKTDDQSDSASNERISSSASENLTDVRTNSECNVAEARVDQRRSKRQSETKELIQKFNSTSLDTPSKPDQMNTMQRLSKEGKINIRCVKCKFHIVKKTNECCKQCLSDYLDSLKKKVSPSQQQQQQQQHQQHVPTVVVTSVMTPSPPPEVNNSHTLEKVKKHVIKKIKCSQCGWKQVDVEGRVCEDCTSEYL